MPYPQYRVIPAIFTPFLLAALTLTTFAQVSDPTLEAADRIFRRAVNATREMPIMQSPDAGQVYTAIRSSRDLDLLPLFEQLRQSKFLDNQIYGMIAASLLSRDSKYVDIPLLLSSKNSDLVGSGIASLIDAGVLTTENLNQIVSDDKEFSHKAMALGELNRKGALKDRTQLTEMLKNEKDIVRCYTAVTMLDNVDPAQTAAALAALKELSNKHDLRQAPVQAIMLLRVQRENLAAAIPWVTQLAADEANDEGLRYTAVATLLALKGPEGPKILADMILKQKEVLQQIKLGLIATEFGSQLTPAQLEPLLKSKSTLAKAIAELALKAAQNVDFTPALVAIIKEGHSIILDWTLDYTDRIQGPDAAPGEVGDRRITLRAAVIAQANIVDQVRDRDYERAALAVQKLLEKDGPAGRKTVESLLRSDNRAIVEATLAGIYRSSAEKQADLVLPIWAGLVRTTSTETAANYAALILAREGRKEPLTWLPGMIMGGTVQGQGFRALAGWYYAKLKDQGAPFLKRVMTP